MERKTKPSVWVLLVFSIGLGVWAETFGEQSDWFYLSRFGLPFMLAYVYSTREAWIDSLRERWAMGIRIQNVPRGNSHDVSFGGRYVLFRIRRGQSNCL